MDFLRVVPVLVMSLFLAGIVAGPVSAAPRQESVTQELIVTATVLPKRRIVVDASGRITQIISNTTEDVRPEVYRYDIAPQNQFNLTESLYQEYRRHVPEGTAQYGVLYDRATSAKTGITSIVTKSQDSLLAVR